jgi:hypothetical protein
VALPPSAIASPEQAAKPTTAQETAAEIHGVIMLSISDIDIDHFF